MKKLSAGDQYLDAMMGEENFEDEFDDGMSEYNQEMQENQCKFH